MLSNAEIRRMIDEGVVAWEREHFEKALETFEKVLEERPDFADVHNKVGLCLAMMGRADDALQRFDRALEINPGYAEAHLNRGIILNELGRHHDAKMALARAAELDTRDSLVFPSELGNDLADAHAKLGDLYLLADLPKEAAEHFRKALEVRPRFQDIRSRYAEALIELGELETAHGELQKVLEVSPYLADARIRLGLVLERLGDREGAVREWHRCAREHPDDMRPRAYLISVGVRLSEDGKSP